MGSTSETGGEFVSQLNQLFNDEFTGQLLSSYYGKRALRGRTAVFLTFSVCLFQLNAEGTCDITSRVVIGWLCSVCSCSLFHCDSDLFSSAVTVTAQDFLPNQ